MNQLISVIIPCYNAENYLREAIESVLAQTYSNLEIIVIDDGSVDKSIEIAQKFGKKIRLISQENKGVSAARNNAVKKSKADWIAFLDADDIWLPKKIKIQLENIEDNVWSYSNSLYIGENQIGDVTRQDLTPQFDGMVFKNLIINNFITTSSVLMRKDIFFKFGGFDESLSALEDWKFWVSISKYHPLKYQPEVLLKYRVYNTSTSRDARNILPIHCKVINYIFNDMSANHPFYKFKRRALSESHLICSYIAEDSLDFTFAFNCSIKALYYQPVNLKPIRRVISSLKTLIVYQLK